MIHVFYQQNHSSWPIVSVYTGSEVKIKEHYDSWIKETIGEEPGGDTMWYQWNKRRSKLDYNRFVAYLKSCGYEELEYMESNA